MVGRYQLLTPLASGGMAEIWLARQPGVRGFEKLVVIKRMVGALEDDPDHVEMFLSEARLAARFSHPHIVQIFELGEARGSFFTVMEFLDGDSLATLFREQRRANNPIPDHLAVKLGAWAAEALHYAHTFPDETGRPMGIVHRDVSPQNLLVTFDGSMKVLDFGIAKINTNATASGKLKGKLAYMAPEQGRAMAVDARTDVFALGVVLFELLSRTRLFPKSDELEILTRITTLSVFPRISERRLDVPPALDDIVAKAMAADPDARFQSAEALQAALEDWLVSTGSRVTSSDVASYVKVLFADRITARKALIESARRGEVLPGADSARAFSTGGSGRGSSDSNGASNPGRAALATTASPTARTQPMEPVDVSVAFDPTKAGIRPKGSSRPKTLLAAGLLLVALAGAGWLVTRPKPGVEPSAVPPPPPATALPTTATLTIEISPPDAKIHVDGAERKAGALELPAGEHAVEVSATGYVADVRKVTLGAGEKLGLVVKLEHLPEAPPADPPTTPKHPDRGPPRAVAKGTLKIDTVPWTSVFLGSKKLGDTPILNAKLPAGRHVLRLVNAESGIEQTIEVEIVANAETVKRLKLK